MANHILLPLPFPGTHPTCQDRSAMLYTTALLALI
ncbi:hypothetical protein ABH995_000917 [Bradyrhizobium yuanmingense]